MKASDNTLLAMVQKKWGVITLDEAIIVDYQFDAIGKLNEDICPVMKNNKWGFLFLKENKLSSFLYRNVGYFQEGLCCVQIENNWGFVNRNLEVALGFFYKLYSPTVFSNSLAKVFDLNNKEILINTSGEIITKYNLHGIQVSGFYEELALFKQNDYSLYSTTLKKYNGLIQRYGFVGINGDIKIPFNLTENNYSNFNNDYSLVSFGYSEPNEYDTGMNYYSDIIGYIDKKGIEYWDDGNDVEFYLNKYKKSKTTFYNKSYHFYCINKTIYRFPNYYKGYIERVKYIFKRNNGYISKAEDSLFYAGLDDIEKSILLNPQNGDSFYWKSILLMKLKKNSDAIISITTAINLDPQIMEYYMTRSLLLYKESLFDKALLDCNVVIENQDMIKTNELISMYTIKITIKETVGDLSVEFDKIKLKKILNENNIELDINERMSLLLK
jgi:hypothetical protein